MAEATTQQTSVDKLITIIWDAEDPESVTNEMVARVLDYLNQGFKSLTTISDNAKLIFAEAETTRKKVTTIANSIGAPEGIAPLDENGKVADNYLPEYKEIYTFAGMVNGPSLQLSSYGGIVVPRSKVYYDTERNTFVMFDSLGKKYYTNWNGSMKFGTTGADGVTPAYDRIYICAADGDGYHWDGSKLVPLCAEATDTEVRDYLASILGEAYLPEAGSTSASCDCEEATLEEIMAAADAVFNND